MPLKDRCESASTSENALVEVGTGAGVFCRRRCLRDDGGRRCLASCQQDYSEQGNDLLHGNLLGGLYHPHITLQSCHQRVTQRAKTRDFFMYSCIIKSPTDAKERNVTPALPAIPRSASKLRRQHPLHPQSPHGHCPARHIWLSTNHSVSRASSSVPCSGPNKLRIKPLPIYAIP